MGGEGADDPTRASVGRGVVEGLSTDVALIEGSKGGVDVFADDVELVVDGAVVVELAGDVDVGETVDGDEDVVVDLCTYVVVDRGTSVVGG